MAQPGSTKKDNLNKKLQLAGEHLKALAAENEKISVQLEEFVTKEAAWESEKSVIIRDREILLEKNLRLAEEIENLKLELIEKNQKNDILSANSRKSPKISPKAKLLSFISPKNEADAQGIPTKHRSYSADFLSDPDRKSLPLNKSRSLNAETVLHEDTEKEVEGALSSSILSPEIYNSEGINKLDTSMGLPWKQFSRKLLEVTNLDPKDNNDTVVSYNANELLQLIKEHESNRISTLEKLSATVELQAKENKFQNQVKDLEAKLTDLTLFKRDSEERMEKLLFALQNIKKKDISLDLPEKEKKIVLELHAIVKQAQELKNNANISKEYEQVLEEKKQLEVEYQMLLDKVGKMQSTLKAKMMAESKEIEDLRKQLVISSDNISQVKSESVKLEQIKKSLEDKIKHYEEELSQNHETIIEMKYQLDYDRQIFESDIRDLETNFLSKQEEIERYKSELNNSSQYVAKVEDKNAELQVDLSKLLNLQNSWIEERNVQNITIQNLQSALESLQMGNESELRDILDQLQEEKHDAEIEKENLRKKISKLEGEITKLTSENDLRNYQNLKSQLEEQSATVAQLRQKIFLLNENLTDSMRRLKEENDENLLDRRVVTSLLVSFFSMSYGDSKRFEVLQLIANILQLDEQQRQKIGLIRKAGKPTPARSSPITNKEADLNQSISDMWISFLLRESSKDA